MGGEHNILLYLAGHIQHHILRGAGVFLLLQGDLRRFRPLLDQGDSILGVDVDTGDHIAFAHIAAKLPGVDVPVGIIGVSVVGDEAHRAVGQNVLVHPVAQIAVDHHDLAPALAQRPGILVAQIIKRSLQRRAPRAHIAPAGNILSIDGEGSLLNVPQGHLKGLMYRLQTPCGNALAQILRRLLFRWTASHTDVGGIGKNLHNLFCVHMLSSSFEWFYHTTFRRFYKAKNGAAPF